MNRCHAPLLRETPVEFFDGNLLDARGDRPLVAERINHCRHSVTVDNVARFLDRSRACFHGTPVNDVDVGDVRLSQPICVWATRSRAGRFKHGEEAGAPHGRDLGAIPRSVPSPASARKTSRPVSDPALEAGPPTLLCSSIGCDLSGRTRNSSGEQHRHCETDPPRTTGAHSRVPQSRP
jgi:hypothetical protein